MSANRLLNGVLRATATGAILAAVATLSAATAQAGEIVSRNCLHGSSESHSFGYRNGYSDEYGSGYGDLSGSAYSYTRPDSFRLNDTFRPNRGFGHRRGLVTNYANPNGGGTASGANAGTGSGYGGGTSYGYGYGSNNGYGDDSCVEIRRELTNPYVIQVPPPQTDKDVAEAAARDRLWQARCRPVIRQDAHGVRRYQYAAPGCEYGKFE